MLSSSKEAVRTPLWPRGVGLQNECLSGAAGGSRRRPELVSWRDHTPENQPVYQKGTFALGKVRP